MYTLFNNLSIELSYLLYFITVFTIAYFISEDAEERGMSGNGWFILIFIFSVISLVLYFIIRKPKLKINNFHSDQTRIFNILRENGFSVEFQDNFKAKGIVMQYKTLEYAISYKGNKITAKIIPPTKLRILYGFLTSILFSFFTFNYINRFFFIAIGFIFIFIAGTFIYDYFYNLTHKKTSIQINFELGRLL